MSFEGYNVIEKNGKPAKKRFTDANAVRTVYQKLRDDDEKEARRRAKIRKMYDGNLPYNPAELRESGLRNITNINFMGLKSVIDNRADMILGLQADTANLIELRPYARELAGPDAEKIARVVAEEFSYTLRSTGKFIPAMAEMNKEADLYGLGPVTWTSSIDYNPVPLERAQVQFVGNGPVRSSDHDLFMYESVLPASYIFQILDNPEVAAEAGWNLKAVKEWAVKVFHDGMETASQPGEAPGTSSIETQLSLFRRNLFDEEHQFDEMKVIHVFVREMQIPRGITHLILPGSAPGGEFLYEKQDAYKTMDECFIWFPYSVSERYARSVRGLASQLFPIEATANRLKCAFVDTAFRNLTVMFTQQTMGGQQSVTLNEQGPYLFIPKELVPVQGNVKPDLQQGVMAMQVLNNIGVASVAGSDMPRISGTGPKLFDTERPTKEEALIQQQQRAHKDTALFVQRSAVMDKIVRQSFVRFVNIIGKIVAEDPVLIADYPEIVEFIDRCQRRGVTVEQILAVPQMFTVATCRDLVLGTEGKTQVLSEVLQGFANLLDEPGRRSIARDFIQLKLGAVSADRYAAEISRDQSPTDQASFAVLENNMIRSGQQVMVGQDQLHWSHIPVHVQILQEIVQQVQAPNDNEGAPAASQAMAGNSGANPNANGANNIENPKQVLMVLMAASKHIQEHLAIGGQQIGMKEQAQQVTKMLRDLRPTVKALNLAVATQERVEQAEREKQERAMAELQQRADQNELEKARYEVDKKAEAEKYRVDREHEVQMYKADLDARRGDAADSIAARRAAGEEARRDAETQSRLDNEAKLNQSKVNAANAKARFDATNEVTGQTSVTPDEFVPDYDMGGPSGYVNL